MRQVFYIDTDEEIISVIGRLRHSSSQENVIVAPKRAMIFQSIVNLRLLDHEARKIGKDIVVVTQDEQGRSLCEKSNIRTQAYLDGEGESADIYQAEDTHQHAQAQASFQQQPRGHQEPSNTNNTQKDERLIRLPHSAGIGSSDFFNGIAPKSSHAEQQSSFEMQKNKDFVPEMYFEQSVQPIERKIFVRDKNPKNFTSLNSQKHLDEIRTQQKNSAVPPSLRGNSQVQSAPAAYMDYSSMQKPSAPKPDYSNPFKDVRKNTVDSNAQPLKPVQIPRFGSEKQKLSLKQPKIPQQSSVSVPKGTFGPIFLFFGLISFLSVAGVGAYLFLPKADIEVVLKPVVQKGDFEFQGVSSEGLVSIESKTIPVRLIETDEDVIVSADTTGKTPLSDQKARGSVVIYNEYSTDPQTLVTSTRLQTKDGKVFRLLGNVLVPGMTESGSKREPGAIEATVIADQSGSEYNIDASDFTIPGFEGSPKYSKFYAKSLKTMSGGGASGSDAFSVSERDVALAKKSAEEKMKTQVRTAIDGMLQSGEKVLDGAIETTVLSSSSSPQVGAVTNTFEYRSKVKVKAMAFSEDALKDALLKLLKKQSDQNNVEASVQDVVLEYGEPTPDFSSVTLRIKVHAVGNFDPAFNKDQLKSDMFGKNASEMEMLLQKYPQIKTISFHLWPEFFVHSIPTRADRVNMTVKSSE